MPPAPALDKNSRLANFIVPLLMLLSLLASSNARWGRRKREGARAVPSCCCREANLLCSRARAVVVEGAEPRAPVCGSRGGATGEEGGLGLVWSEVLWVWGRAQSSSPAAFSFGPTDAARRRHHPTPTKHKRNVLTRETVGFFGKRGIAVASTVAVVRAATRNPQKRGRVKISRLESPSFCSGEKDASVAASHAFTPS